MAKVAVAAKAAVSEEKRVEYWRRDVLLEANVGVKWLLELARCDADLHKIVRAKQAGCHDYLLVKIFC